MIQRSLAATDVSDPPADSRERIVACDLGRVAYRPSWELQRKLQARLVAAKRGTAPPAPHVLLTVEHPPVVTMGKSGSDENLLLDETALAGRGIEFVRIDRGGDVTYHGPGQLVGYPILDLGRFFTDIHRYLRELEEAVIGVCDDFGITAGRVDGRTGVWVGPDDRGPERKICAMGIRCSRWVTMHGLALNVATDLDHFDIIVPCGIRDRGVTSIEREAQRDVSLAEAGVRLVDRIVERFDAHADRLAGHDAYDFLSHLLDEPVEPSA